MAAGQQRLVQQVTPGCTTGWTQLLGQRLPHTAVPPNASLAPGPAPASSSSCAESRKPFTQLSMSAVRPSECRERDKTEGWGGAYASGMGAACCTAANVAHQGLMCTASSGGHCKTPLRSAGLSPAYRNLRCRGRTPAPGSCAGVHCRLGWRRTGMSAGRVEGGMILSLERGHPRATASAALEK